MLSYNTVGSLFMVNVTRVIVGCFAGLTRKTSNQWHTQKPIFFFFVILVVYTQFTNVAVGRIIHAAGPRVVDPWCMAQNLKCNLFRVSHD